MIMEKKKFGEMVSVDCYNEVKEKLQNFVGEKAMQYIFPAVEKALEEGDAEVRTTILNEWLDIDTCRVCSECGAIMQEGWYLDCHGYACSDECCCKIMGISKEEFDRYSIFLPEIELHLEEEGDERKPDELSKDEINEIIDEIMANLDAYYYTEWY